ncbi:uncharacterized protein DSM5745_01195 [Aspergillus mulundensis]|uniref:Uncharacterized protein n=1 Tax=Aspergillus mulundensis TaxID=1810919 RepID=A0A3D8T5P6_9EURO|nr:hypothetical protein DSM5745_01195 [Aspergillus mulundensis]RDW93873.1 hypothetical protein DSM5745_01195 [Aspergillus mulundensis]
MSLHNRSLNLSKGQHPQLQRSSAVKYENLQARRQALEEANIKKLLIPSQEPEREAEPEPTPPSPTCGLRRSSAVKYSINPLTRRHTQPQLSSQDVRDFSSSPTDSSDSWDAPSMLTRASTLSPSAGDHLTDRTLRDMELPHTLHEMVDNGVSCTEMGRYIVNTVPQRDSFYAELVNLLVGANKPYYEICVRMFQAMNLTTEEGHRLDTEAPVGDLDMRPDLGRPIQGCVVDGPGYLPADHRLYPVLGEVALYPFEYGDLNEPVEHVANVAVVTGKARLVEIERLHAPKSVHGSLRHVDDESCPG